MKKTLLQAISSFPTMFPTALKTSPAIETTLNPLRDLPILGSSN